MSDWLSRLPTFDGDPLLGKVRVLREIGRGGMGVVYAGWHTVLDIPVAVKLLCKSAGSGEDVLARFRREAQICAAIDEPCLVRVFDFDATDEGPYLVMEYVAGRSLDDVAAAAPLNEAEVLSLLRDLAVVLLSLHRADIVHRDIKPSNLLLRTADGRIKLTDLGIAKAPGTGEQTETNQVIGTPAFMSPEQFREPARVGPASDFFSLGATAFHLLTGQRPFAGESAYEVMRAICEQPLPAEPLVRRGVSESTCRLLRDLTAKGIAAPLARAGNSWSGFPPLLSHSARRRWRPPGPGTSSAERNQASFAPRGHCGRPPPFSRRKPLRPWTRRGLCCRDVGRSSSVSACRMTSSLRSQPADRPRTSCTSAGTRPCAVVGPDPAKGPLVRALSACAAADHLRIVHVRDWHDADDPRQKPELGFFGPHCLMGSWGARFVDAIESFSRDRGRSAVVDATGINDFEDTPLEETLAALVEGEHPATIPVGVIGVWTNVKVHYLLYDLKTRLHMHNLATCSRLVAAPDRVEHRNTLRHLETVLNVKVFHEVDEFLAFLGVSSISAGATTLTTAH